MRKIFLGGISCLQAPAYGASPGPNLVAVYRYKVASLLSANFLGVLPQNTALFLSTVKERGERKHTRGFAPLNPPVGLLAQKAHAVQ